MNWSCASVAGLVAASSASAEVVYNAMTAGNPNPFWVNFTHDRGESSSTDEQPGGSENDSQTGQHVTLGGTSRFVTQIDMRIGGYGTPPFDLVSMAMTLRIYGLSSGMPGSLLWEGTSAVQTFSVTFTGNSVPVSFSPNVQLPDNVVLAVSHSQISGQLTSFVGTVGQGTPGDVGVDDPGWFMQDTTTGAWRVLAVANDHIQARITAVPAPATVGLALVGVGLWRRRRR
jgi:hypothetical protein